jgi:hypothetical protein
MLGRAVKWRFPARYFGLGHKASFEQAAEEVAWEDSNLRPTAEKACIAWLNQAA